MSLCFVDTLTGASAAAHKETLLLKSLPESLKHPVSFVSIIMMHSYDMGNASH